MFYVCFFCPVIYLFCFWKGFALLLVSFFDSISQTRTHYLAYTQPYTHILFVHVCTASPFLNYPPSLPPSLPPSFPFTRSVKSQPSIRQRKIITPTTTAAAAVIVAAAAADGAQIPSSIVRQRRRTRRGIQRQLLEEGGGNINIPSLPSSSSPSSS